MVVKSEISFLKIRNLKTNTFYALLKVLRIFHKKCNVLDKNDKYKFKKYF